MMKILSVILAVCWFTNIVVGIIKMINGGSPDWVSYLSACFISMMFFVNIAVKE